MNRNQIIAVSIAAALVVGYLFLPVWQARNRYYGSDSAVEKCAAAQDVALAWRSLAIYGWADEWESKAGLDCFSAEVYSRVG